MSKYKRLKEKFGSIKPEERVIILRHELLRPVNTVRGYAALLKEFEQSDKQKLPKEFDEYVDKILEAGDDLLEILDALTG
jgi:signal transduction histidine kinase